MFSSATSLEPRIIPFVTYVCNIYQYKKTVQIPKGATLALPPEATMNQYVPMGFLPGYTNKFGYVSSNLISSNSTQDTYYLITESREITYNISGQQVATEDNPIFVHPTLKKPSDYIYPYQYVLW